MTLYQLLSKLQLLEANGFGEYPVKIPNYDDDWNGLGTVIDAEEVDLDSPDNRAETTYILIC